MHPALSIAELLFCIFNDPELASPQHNPEVVNEERWLRRHPLLSLALCCKTFSHVALSVLWKDIDGLGQLLWTMSDDVIQVSEEEEYATDSDSPLRCKSIAFKKQPVEQDWEPFDRYGALVTGFKNDYFYCSPIQEISYEIVKALNARYDLEGKPFLPNIQSLACNEIQLRFAHTLLGPHLRSLSIYSDTARGHASGLESFLKLAKFDPSTRLSVLELRCTRESRLGPKIDPLVSELISNIQRMGDSLHTLRSIADPQKNALEAPQEILYSLLANERMREIGICVEKFDLDRALPPDTSVTRNALHTLMIRATNGVTTNPSLGASFFYELFRRLNAPNLASFMFQHCAGYISVSDTRTIFTSLRPDKAFGRAAMGSKRPVILIAPLSRREAMTVIPAHHICTFANSFYILCQPISSTDPTPRFARLHNLSLCVLVDLSDSDINTLSLALPRLKNFHVETHRGGRTGKSRTTLIGLWFLAKNCPRIKYVDIWFNAVLDWDKFADIIKPDVFTIIDPEDRRSVLQEARNMNWTSIEIGDSYIGDVDIVTEFIKEVCPRLHDMRAIGRTEDGWEKWKAIGNMLLRRYNRYQYQ